MLTLLADSAELTAVSSIITFDVFLPLRPSATPKQLFRVAHLSTAVFGERRSSVCVSACLYYVCSSHSR